MRRFWSVVAGLVLVVPGVAACGGGGDGGLGFGETVTTSDAVTPGAADGLRSVEVVAAEALALFDEQLGVTAVALLAAADRGYSPAQIDRAVEDGTLTEAGGVVTEAGEVVVPEWPAEDFIQAKPPVVTGGEEGAAPAPAAVELVGYVVGRAGTMEPVTWDGLRNTFEGDVLAAMDAAVAAGSTTSTTVDPVDSDEVRAARSLEAIGLIAYLQAEGYTVEQIILAVVGGLVRFDGWRAYIEGETPEGRSQPVYQEQTTTPTTTTTAPAASGTEDQPIDFPRTYRTEEGSHYLADYMYGIPFDCTTPGPMELILAADGTATFTYFNGVGVVGTLSDDDTPQITCEPRPGNTWTGTYDAELQTFEILPPAPEGIESWDVGGTFDDDEAFLYGIYRLPPNNAGQQMVVEIEASMTATRQ